MSRETILKIKETEAEAARIIEEAEAKAKVMRAEAEEAGKTLCRTAERERSEELNGMLEQIRLKTEQMAEHVLAETKEEATAVAATARLNRKSAEKIVIRGLDAKCR